MPDNATFFLGTKTLVLQIGIRTIKTIHLNTFASTNAQYISSLLSKSLNAN